MAISPILGVVVVVFGGWFASRLASLLQLPPVLGMLFAGFGFQVRTILAYASVN